MSIISKQKRAEQTSLFILHLSLSLSFAFNYSPSFFLLLFLSSLFFFPFCFLSSHSPLPIFSFSSQLAFQLTACLSSTDVTKWWPLNIIQSFPPSRAPSQRGFGRRPMAQKSCWDFSELCQYFVQRKLLYKYHMYIQYISDYNKFNILGYIFTKLTNLPFCLVFQLCHGVLYALCPCGKIVLTSNWRRGQLIS